MTRVEDFVLGQFIINQEIPKQRSYLVDFLPRRIPVLGITSYTKASLLEND